MVSRRIFGHSKDDCLSRECSVQGGEKHSIPQANKETMSSIPGEEDMLTNKQKEEDCDSWMIVEHQIRRKPANFNCSSPETARMERKVNSNQTTAIISKSNSNNVEVTSGLGKGNSAKLYSTTAEGKSTFHKGNKAEVLSGEEEKELSSLFVVGGELSGVGEEETVLPGVGGEISSEVSFGKDKMDWTVGLDRPSRSSMLDWNTGLDRNDGCSKLLGQQQFLQGWAAILRQADMDLGQSKSKLETGLGSWPINLKTIEENSEEPYHQGCSTREMRKLNQTNKKSLGVQSLNLQGEKRSMKLLSSSASGQVGNNKVVP